jgi:hypothetical protein
MYSVASTQEFFDDPLCPERMLRAPDLRLIVVVALAIRYGGVLFLFPLTYYFSHPEAFRMRPIDPLLVILGCYAILHLRGCVGDGAETSPAA